MGLESLKCEMEAFIMASGVKIILKGKESILGLMARATMVNGRITSSKDKEHTFSKRQGRQRKNIRAISKMIREVVKVN